MFRTLSAKRSTTSMNSFVLHHAASPPGFLTHRDEAAFHQRETGVFLEGGGGREIFRFIFREVMKGQNGFMESRA